MKSVGAFESKNVWIPECFDHRDVDRLRKDDGFVTRYYQHVSDQPGNHIDNAVKMIKTSFKVRKEYDVYGKFQKSKQDHPVDYELG